MTHSSTGELEEQPFTERLPEGQVRLIRSSQEIDHLIEVSSPAGSAAAGGERPARAVVRARAGVLGQGVAVRTGLDASLLLPFRFRTVHLPCRLGYSAIANCPVQTVELPGAVWDGPAEPQALELALTTILQAERGCSLSFPSLRTDSPLWRLLRESAALRRECWIYLPFGVVDYWMLKLEGSFDEYLARFSGRTRRKMQNAVRRLEAQDAVHVRRVDSEEGVRPFLEQVARLSRRTWQGTRLGSVVEASQERRERLCAEASRGWLRSYLLSVGDAPIAFAMGRQVDGIFYYDQVGYDPAWAEYSPGKVLLYRIIEDLFTVDPPEWLDFGYGDTEYKRFFGTHRHEVANVYALRKGTYTGAVLALHSTCVGLTSSVRLLLERTNLKSHVRRVLRR